MCAQLVFCVRVRLRFCKVLSGFSIVTLSIHGYFSTGASSVSVEGSKKMRKTPYSLQFYDVTREIYIIA